jgi:hypothetical protein
MDEYASLIGNGFHFESPFEEAINTAESVTDGIYEGYSEVYQSEENADYTVKESQVVSASGWDLGNWVNAEHKSTETNRKERAMSEDIYTIRGELIVALPGNTGTGKPKQEALIAPDEDVSTADLVQTPVGTLKVQSSDPLTMAMFEALEPRLQVEAQIEKVSFLGDTGVIEYNKVHSIALA